MSDSQQPQVIDGLGVSPGVAIGRAVCIENEALEIYRFPLPADSVELEIDRLREATQRARNEILATRARAEEELAPIRERRRELAARPDDVRDVLAAGTRRARELARQTMEVVREKVGVGGGV